MLWEAVWKKGEKWGINLKGIRSDYQEPLFSHGNACCTTAWMPFMFMLKSSLSAFDTSGRKHLSVQISHCQKFQTTVKEHQHIPARSDPALRQCFCWREECKQRHLEAHLDPKQCLPYLLVMYEGQVTWKSRLQPCRTAFFLLSYSFGKMESTWGDKEIRKGAFMVSMVLNDDKEELKKRK